MNTGLIASRLFAFAADGVPCEELKNEQLDYTALYKFSKAHSIVNTVCYALEKLNMLPEEYAALFCRELKIGRAREATQELELEEISAQLEGRGIKYMPLKGSVMKHLYPRPDLRSMCDLDIQYDKSRKNELDEIMLPMGYEVAEVSGTDGVNIAYRKKPFMYIEFHGVLMDTDIPLYNSYFGTDFERTVPESGCRVKYTDEDFFVFMAAHLAKHYFLGGTGLRSLADIWLFLRKKPGLDTDYIFEELKKIRLDEFIKIIIGVNGVLFDGKAPDETQKTVINYILGSGTYGTMENRSADNIKDSSKLKYLLARLFPDRKFMAINYPAVDKCVLLLPLFWVIRLVSTFVKKGYKGSDVDMVMNVSTAQIDARNIPGNPAQGG